MKELTINIRENEDEGGYWYDIYELDARDVDYTTESFDGGHCKSDNILNALDMSIDTAEGIVLRKKNKRIEKLHDQINDLQETIQLDAGSSLQDLIQELVDKKIELDRITR